MYAPGTVTVRRMLNCPIEVPRKNVVTANRAAQSHSKMVHYVWETAFLADGFGTPPFLFNRRLPSHCTFSAALGAKESTTTPSFCLRLLSNPAFVDTLHIYS